jgi:cytochrome c peroxidase
MALRNVELTSPDFQHGAAATLTEAVDIMGQLQLGKKFSTTAAFANRLSEKAPALLL